MKKIILMFMAVLFAGVANASIEGTIDDVVCAEMDPFAIGDACVILTTDDKTGAKLGLLYWDYDWYAQFVEESESEFDTIGDQFTARACEKIKDVDVIRVLKDYNPEYFYLSCETSSFSWK